MPSETEITPIVVARFADEKYVPQELLSSSRGGSNGHGAPRLLGVIGVQGKSNFRRKFPAGFRLIARGVGFLLDGSHLPKGGE